MIKTPRFHLVDGPADERLREAVLRSDLPVPPSYRQFVIRFGNARLYRRASNNSYQIGVFASPRQSTLDDGLIIYHLGFHDGASVYVRSERLSAESPIFEFEGQHERQVAGDFENWLVTSSAKARNAYNSIDWAEIVRGPKPFTDEELAMIDTRRRIQWREIGLAEDGSRVFEVKNGSDRVLSVLTVGVRSKDSRLNGVVGLRIGHIAPNQSGIVNASCYKDLVPPDEIEVFPLPDPRPEDRALYYEFAAPS